MKKSILLIITILLFAFQASAQFSAGVLAGAMFSTPKFADISMKNPAKVYAGLTCNVDLPSGFSIQPAVTFVSKEAYFRENLKATMQAIEIPLSFQWGPDLLIFRPFIDVTPFVGVKLKTHLDTHVADGLDVNKPLNPDGEILEYGLGLGGGIDVWKLRVTARYNWNMGPLFKNEKFNILYKKSNVVGAIYSNRNFSRKFEGISLAVIKIIYKEVVDMKYTFAMAGQDDTMDSIVASFGALVDQAKSKNFVENDEYKKNNKGRI